MNRTDSWKNLVSIASRVVGAILIINTVLFMGFWLTWFFAPATPVDTAFAVSDCGKDSCDINVETSTDSMYLGAIEDYYPITHVHAQKPVPLSDADNFEDYTVDTDPIELQEGDIVYVHVSMSGDYTLSHTGDSIQMISSSGYKDEFSLDYESGDSDE